MSDKNRREPLKLVKNRRYPTYQLYALSANRKTAPETVLRIAVLQTMQWLRERFRDFEIPEPLNLPPADRYSDITLEELRSFHINEGYKVDVVWLPEEKNWTLQLTEPDLGPSPGEGTQKRAPVPGRLIETNVAYRIKDGRVACAFCVIVAEPECTTDTCEVFRFGFIKHLARNPLIGLEQGYPLLDTPMIIDTSSKVERLTGWLKSGERTLPAVIATEYQAQSAALLTIEELCSSISVRSIGVSQTIPPVAMPSENKQLIDITALARYKMGYAQYFLINADKLGAFSKAVGLALTPGELLLWEPESFGGDVKTISVLRQERELETVENEINDFAQNYPLGKPVGFGAALFMPEARLVENKHIFDVSESKEELLLTLQKTEATMNAVFDRKRADLQEKIALANEKIERLKQSELIVESEWKQQKSDLIRSIDELKAALADRDAEIERLRGLSQRPKLPKEVDDWVKQRFDGRLIFHAKAASLMSSIAPAEVDMKLVCDALEYLATDYRDALIGEIDEHERNLRCSYKYGRPFDVTPISGLSAETYPSDYRIKYYRGYNGNLVESPLDLHLRVGNDSENLLRIYFLYDKDKQLIVVGSLPKHLKTMGYK